MIEKYAVCVTLLGICFLGMCMGQTTHYQGPHEAIEVDIRKCGTCSCLRHFKYDTGLGKQDNVALRFEASDIYVWNCGKDYHGQVRIDISDMDRDNKYNQEGTVHLKNPYSQFRYNRVWSNKFDTKLFCKTGSGDSCVEYGLINSDVRCADLAIILDERLASWESFIDGLVAFMRDNNVKRNDFSVTSLTIQGGSEFNVHWLEVFIYEATILAINDKCTVSGPLVIKNVRSVTMTELPNMANKLFNSFIVENSTVSFSETQTSDSSQNKLVNSLAKSYFNVWRLGCAQDQTFYLRFSKVRWLQPFPTIELNYQDCEYTIEFSDNLEVPMQSEDHQFIRLRHDLDYPPQVHLILNEYRLTENFLRGAFKIWDIRIMENVKEARYNALGDYNFGAMFFKDVDESEYTKYIITEEKKAYIRAGDCASLIEAVDGQFFVHLCAFCKMTRSEIRIERYLARQSCHQITTTTSYSTTSYTSTDEHTTKSSTPCATTSFTTENQTETIPVTLESEKDIAVAYGPMVHVLLLAFIKCAL